MQEEEEEVQEELRSLPLVLLCTTFATTILPVLRGLTYLALISHNPPPLTLIPDQA